MIGFATNRQYQGNVKTVGSNTLLGYLANLLMSTRLFAIANQICRYGLSKHIPVVHKHEELGLHERHGV